MVGADPIEAHVSTSNFSGLKISVIYIPSDPRARLNLILPAEMKLRKFDFCFINVNNML
jgi:hypothetical protein